MNIPFWRDTIQPQHLSHLETFLFLFGLCSQFFVGFFVFLLFVFWGFFAGGVLEGGSVLNEKFTEMLFMLMGQLRIIVIKRQLCLLNHVYFPSPLVVPCGEKNFPLTLSNLAHLFSLSQCLKYPFIHLS